MRFFRLLIMMLVTIMALAACEEGTTIAIDGNNPPSISFKGSGYISLLTVEEVTSKNQKVPDPQQSGDNPIIWWIAPVKTLNEPIRKLAPVTYGKTPDGFYQKVPHESQAAPVLEEGKVYEIWVAVSGARAGQLRFTIQDVKSVTLEIPK